MPLCISAVWSHVLVTENQYTVGWICLIWISAMLHMKWEFFKVAYLINSIFILLDLFYIIFSYKYLLIVY